VYLITTPVPSLTSPSDGAINLKPPVQLSWTNIDSLQSNWVQISTSQNFSEITKDINLKNSVDLAFATGTYKNSLF
jgi:hypothetical protein